MMGTPALANSNDQGHKRSELAVSGLDFYHKPVKTARRKLTAQRIGDFRSASARLTPGSHAGSAHRRVAHRGRISSEASRHLFGCAARGFSFRRVYRFGAGQYHSH